MGGAGVDTPGTKRYLLPLIAGISPRRCTPLLRYLRLGMQAPPLRYRGCVCQCPAILVFPPSHTPTCPSAVVHPSSPGLVPSSSSSTLACCDRREPLSSSLPSALPLSLHTTHYSLSNTTCDEAFLSISSLLLRIIRNHNKVAVYSLLPNPPLSRPPPGNDTETRPSCSCRAASLHFHSFVPIHQPNAIYTSLIKGTVPHNDNISVVLHRALRSPGSCTDTGLRVIYYIASPSCIELVPVSSTTTSVSARRGVSLCSARAGSCSTISSVAIHAWLVHGF